MAVDPALATTPITFRPRARARSSASAQALGTELEARVDRHWLDAALTEPGDLKRAFDRIVSLISGEERERWARGDASVQTSNTGALLSCGEQGASGCRRSHPSVKKPSAASLQPKRWLDEAREGALHRHLDRAHLVDRGAVVRERAHEARAARPPGSGEVTWWPT